jgi:predicted outer membrane lipoprotein
MNAYGVDVARYIFKIFVLLLGLGVLLACPFAIRDAVKFENVGVVKKVLLVVVALVCTGTATAGIVLLASDLFDIIPSVKTTIQIGGIK